MKPIKPNTVCMIKSPEAAFAYLNGRIVIALTNTVFVGVSLWRIDPPQPSNPAGEPLVWAREDVLVPLDDPHDDEVDTHSFKELANAQ